jgi:hypothetical protein
MPRGAAHVSEAELGQHQRETEQKRGAERQHLRVVEQVAALTSGADIEAKLCDPARPKN